MRKTILSLAAMLLVACSASNEVTAANVKMYITIDNKTLPVTLVDNAATQALVERLQSSSVTVTLNSSGGFEIWGALGFSLPTNNQQITAQPGDVILYNGSNICLFYGSNSWSYTRLGHIEYTTQAELEEFLKAGQSNINVMLSLTAGTTTAIDNVHTACEPGVYYTMRGLKVAHPTHGIYILRTDRKFLSNNGQDLSCRQHRRVQQVVF